MNKKICFVLLYFATALFAFNSVSYDIILNMAREVNKKLELNVNFESAEINLFKKPVIALAYKNEPNSDKKRVRIKRPALTISRNVKKETISLIHLPYLTFNEIVKQIIGSPDDMENSLCKIKIGNKEKIDSCKHVKKWVDERNRLLDEFIRNLYKLKMDINKRNIYYRGKFSCGILYKYYTYKHYNDCYKLFNYINSQERETIYDYVKSFLSF